MESVNSKLKNLASKLPQLPGVYIMKNSEGKILYIGKANSLRSRVKSYFSNRDQSVKNIFLIKHLDKLDYIITKTEAEALLLEASLVKKHKPRYNIRLKDDKAYPYIRCSIKQDFPRFYLERRVQDRKSLYFGPYTQGGAVRNIMNFLNQNFKIRDCKDGNFKTRKRPCLTHQLGFCQAPCVGLQNKSDYQQQVQQSLKFLKSKSTQLSKQLHVEMSKHAKAERFEEAGRIKNQLHALQVIHQNQSVVRASRRDQDIVFLLNKEQGSLVQFIYLRQGRLIGTRHQFFYKVSLEETSLLSFLNQYYEENVIPDDVLLHANLSDFPLSLLEQALRLHGKNLCKVRQAKDKKLLQLARSNAENAFKDLSSKSKKQEEALKEIQKKFHLKQLPSRIECYDISHWQGKGMRGAQVVFEDARPKSKDYRLYKIKTLQSPDDYASLVEVLKRRFKDKNPDLPGLILIDGGKGQLQACLQALKDMRVSVPIVSLAKDRVKPSKNLQASKYSKDVHGSGERFYLPGRKNPCIFPKSSEALNLLLALRDEAHRFSIEAHRKTRDKTFLQGDLDHIQGLGPKRKQILLKKFQSLNKLKQASLEDISQIQGISLSLARRIHVDFCKKKN